MRRHLLTLILLLTQPLLVSAQNSARVQVADAFDFPVGKPEGAGFHKARGFRSNGHLGEDWNGSGGGDSDLGDPVHAIANGVVVLATNVRQGWGNVVIVRHAYYENGQIEHIDSLYGHLHDFRVRVGETVTRGQRIGSIGSNFGMYDAHLHLEIRKNLTIGMQRASFARDTSNYFDPTAFIKTHRTLRGGPGTAEVALNTFAYPQDFSGATLAYARESATSRNPNLKTRISASRGEFKVQRFGDLDRW